MRNINKLANHNSIQIVKSKMNEELEELLEAIEENDEKHILEEIADVWVTTYQYILKKGLEEEFKQMKEYKIQRTIKRLNIGSE